MATENGMGLASNPTAWRVLLALLAAAALLFVGYKCNGFSGVRAVAGRPYGAYRRPRAPPAPLAPPANINDLQINAPLGTDLKLTGAPRGFTAETWQPLRCLTRTMQISSSCRALIVRCLISHSSGGDSLARGFVTSAPDPSYSSCARGYCWEYNDRNWKSSCSVLRVVRCGMSPLNLHRRSHPWGSDVLLRPYS